MEIATNSMWRMCCLHSAAELTSDRTWRARRNWGAGTSGVRDQAAEEMRSSRDYTSTYTGGMSEGEQMYHAIQQSIREGKVKYSCTAGMNGQCLLNSCLLLQSYL